MIVNRLIQSHPSDVGVGAGGGDSSASLCTQSKSLSKVISMDEPVAVLYEMGCGGCPIPPCATLPVSRVIELPVVERER